MTTIKDVAVRAGVSPSTVSRVLSDSPRISETTKTRVRLAMEELRYHPNVVARALVTNSAGAIGILVPSEASEFFENPFFSQMMSGVSMVARREGFDIVLSTAGKSEEDAIESMIRSRRVDGVLLLRSRFSDPALAIAISQSFPVTLLGRPADDVEVSFVNNDNVDAAYTAAKHLAALGHKRIGFLGGARELTVIQDRVSGYRRALEEFNIAYDERMVISTTFMEQGGYQAMMRLLALSDRPTAVLASDDVLAFGAMRAAAELGHRLPSDMSIVGFNDIRLAELANPALTSVRVHMQELGQAATELLIEQIQAGERLTKTRIIPTELIVRHSCGAMLPQDTFSMNLPRQLHGGAEAL